MEGRSSFEKLVEKYLPFLVAGLVVVVAILLPVSISNFHKLHSAGTFGSTGYFPAIKINATSDSIASAVFSNFS